MAKKTRPSKTSAPESPQRAAPDARPTDEHDQQWMKVLLSAGAFSVHPEIEGALRRGELIKLDRAKEIAVEVLAALRDHLPRMAAIRDALRAVDDLRDAARLATQKIARADDVILSDPSRYLTLKHEQAHRAGRIARRIVDERKIITDEDLAAIAPEVYDLTRREMEAEGRESPSLEAQDLAPMGLLRLGYGAQAVESLLNLMERPADALKWVLSSGLSPHGEVGRPTFAFAMFVAWLLQDAVLHRMTDHHVVRLIEDACKDFSSDWPNLVPTPRTVAQWRREREKIQGICPRRDRP